MNQRILEWTTLLGAICLWTAACVLHVCDWLPRWTLYAMAPLMMLVAWQVTRWRARRRDADDPLRPWHAYKAASNLNWSATPEDHGALELQLVTDRVGSEPGVRLRFHGVRALGVNVDGVYGPRFGGLIACRFWDRSARQWRLRVQDRSGTVLAFLCDSVAEVRENAPQAVS